MSSAYQMTTGTTGTTTGTTIPHWVTAATTSNSTLSTISTSGTLWAPVNSSAVVISGPSRLTVGDDQTLKIELPDGRIIDIVAGEYQIIDPDGARSVRYKPNRLREFNRYVNASDLLEEFVDFAADAGIESREEFFDLPVELFIRWLIIRAAEADGEAPAEDRTQLLSQIKPPSLALPAPRRATPHCRYCGRFLNRKRFDLGVMFCSSDHYNRYAVKVGLD